MRGSAIAQALIGVTAITFREGFVAATDPAYGRAVASGQEMSSAT